MSKETLSLALILFYSLTAMLGCRCRGNKMQRHSLKYLVKTMSPLLIQVAKCKVGLHFERRNPP